MSSDRNHDDQADKNLRAFFSFVAFVVGGMTLAAVSEMDKDGANNNNPPEVVIQGEALVAPEQPKTVLTNEPK